MRTSLSNPLRVPSLALKGYSQKNRGSIPCSRHMRQDPGKLAWPKIKNRITLSGKPAVRAGARPLLFRPHVAMGIGILPISYTRKSSVQMSRGKLDIHHNSFKKIYFNSTIIAFAKSSCLLSPLPPAGGEGQGEGGEEKTFGNEYKVG